MKLELEVLYKSKKLPNTSSYVGVEIVRPNYILYGHQGIPCEEWMQLYILVKCGASTL